MLAVSVTAERFWTSRPYGSMASIGPAADISFFDRRNGALDKVKALAAGASLERKLADARSSADIDSKTRLMAQRTLALKNYRRHSAFRSPVVTRVAEDSMGRQGIDRRATRCGAQQCRAHAGRAAAERGTDRGATLARVGQEELLEGPLTGSASHRLSVTRMP